MFSGFVQKVHEYIHCPLLMENTEYSCTNIVQTASKNINREWRCQMVALIKALLLRDRKLANADCEVENAERIT